MDQGLTGLSSPEPKTTSPFGSEFPEPNLHRTGSCSSSSSSDSSEGNDFFQLDPLGFGHLPEPLHPPQVPVRSENGDPSPKPPVHPMAVRNDVPDPYRIPSSIFARTKSTSPMEWSVASNESLFSIHMGNASFSRDHMFPNSRQDDQISFSGLSSSSSQIQDSYSTSPAVSISSQLPPLPPLAPVVSTPMSLPPQLPVSSHSEMSSREESEEEEAQLANAEAMKDEPLLEEQESHKEKSGPNRINYSPSVSSKSDASASSIQSFAFPILAGGGTNGSSIRSELEHQNMLPKMVEQQKPKMPEASHTTQHVEPEPKAASAKGGWFSCFSCCASR